MKLWIDDVRPAPEGYCWAKSVYEALIYCGIFYHKALLVDEINLDHDAGQYANEGGDYIHLLNWLEKLQHENGWIILPHTQFKIHSMNPVGRMNMRQICKRNRWNLAD